MENRLNVFCVTGSCDPLGVVLSCRLLRSEQFFPMAQQNVIQVITCSPLPYFYNQNDPNSRILKRVLSNEQFFISGSCVLLRM